MRKDSTVVRRSKGRTPDYTSVANLYRSSTIIEAVKDFCPAGTTRKLAYFYFDFNDTDKQDVVILLRSLIKQLCTSELELPQIVQTLYTHYRASGQQPSIKELSSIFFSVIDELKKEIYIIMDALDEYPENPGDPKSKRKDLLDQIKRMVEHGSENLHILAMSRNEHDIHDTLERPAAGGISIQSSKVDADIKLHVRTCLAEDAVLKRLPGKVKGDIEVKLGERAHGMRVNHFSRSK
jgi:hypothetical protein